ncbi:MAG TPA: CHAT domain-containing tetratricopeptide repeat protein [Vicinamibacterales bacterium]
MIASLETTRGAVRQAVDDPALRAVVERFFATQQAEDVDGYLALWSAKASRPTLAQLKYVFESGDDEFSDVSIAAVSPSAAGPGAVRVRVNATRQRTMPGATPDAPVRTMRTTAPWNLVFVREADEWKLLREGPAIEGLLDALLESKTTEERDALLGNETDLVNDLFLNAIARRASQSAQMSRYAEAQRQYELLRDVARRVGNLKVAGEALQNLANSLYYQRNYHAALQYYDERLALERTRDDPESIASALLGTATVRYTLAEYGTALAAYREALAIQERLGEERPIAVTLISTGNVLYLQGDYPAAIADYTRSRDINKRILNAIGEADALSGIGRVYLAQGDYLSALEAFAGVLAERKSRNQRHDQGAVLLSIGDVHFRLGNLDHARRAFDEARAHFEFTKTPADVGRAWQALALTDLVASRFSLAEQGYGKASAACAAAADSECVASTIVGLAFAQTAQEKYPEGIASYRKGIDAFTALNRREQAARAEIGLAQALAGSEDFKGSLTASAHARTEAEALRNDDVTWRALVSEANALRHLRERARATAAAEAAVAIVERLAEASKARPSIQVPRDSSAAFGMLALLQADAADGAAAFELIERMRTHDLRALLARGERDITRGMTDAEREEERTLAVDVVSLDAQVSREKSLPKPDAARIARLEKAVAEAIDRRAAQQRRLFERLPALKVWRGQMPPATRADLEALLTDKTTVVLQFVVGEDTLLVIAARRNDEGLQFSSMFEAATRKAIAVRVATLLQQEMLTDPAKWKAAAKELVPGLSAVIGNATRAIVVPHEVLWRVPFEALPTDEGYVADTASVVYAPSITALVKSPPPEPLATAPTPPTEAVSDRPSPVVVVAAPQLPAAVVDGLAQTAPDWPIRLAASGEREVKELSASIDPERLIVIQADGASEAAVRERIRQADVLHLAAPFRVNGASPLFSQMLLTPDASNDGALESREIMNLDLAARVAIFSDGTAMTMREAADEVPAIAWAWRAANVRTVVMPRWTADEARSTEMLTELHARLRAGDTPEAAVQSARAKVRRSSAGAVPLQWAGWIVIVE